MSSQNYSGGTHWLQAAGSQGETGASVSPPARERRQVKAGFDTGWNGDRGGPPADSTVARGEEPPSRAPPRQLVEDASTPAWPSAASCPEWARPIVAAARRRRQSWQRPNRRDVARELPRPGRRWLGDRWQGARIERMPSRLLPPRAHTRTPHPALDRRVSGLTISPGSVSATR
jgi:hypothetical protein